MSLNSVTTLETLMVLFQSSPKSAVHQDVHNRDIIQDKSLPHFSSLLAAFVFSDVCLHPPRSGSATPGGDSGSQMKIPRFLNITDDNLKV